MHIDILNYEITIDGKELRFPMSYEEVKSVMGEASRVLVEDWGTLYIYDDQGLFFEDQNSTMYLKKQMIFILRVIYGQYFLILLKSLKMI